MPTPVSQNLSRRERQIMNVIYQRGRATAAEVQKHMPDPPSYSAVRAMLKILLDKKIMTAEKDGPRYVYLPTKARKQAGKSAIKIVLATFFEGSVDKAMAALLDARDGSLTDAELDNLQDLVKQARKEGR